MKKILFVCLGNICRSPTAEVLFRARLSEAGYELEIESAGTIAHHEGRPPDSRAVEHARKWGLDMSGLRAREVVEADFWRFDRIFAMDRSNLAELQRRRPADSTAQVQLLMHLVPDYGIEEVPDPYYGGDAGFRRVIDMLDHAAERLLAELRQLDR